MSLVKAELDEARNQINVHADFADKDLVLTLPGARWFREGGYCTLPLTWNACKQLRAILGERLDISDNLYDWAVAEYTARVGPCFEIRQSTTPIGTVKLCDGLYPFQQAGAEFLVLAQQAILADPMGSGKTVQAIAAARATNSLPAIIICPNSMKRTWAKEVEKWWPGTPVFVVEGTKTKRAKTIQECGKQQGICIINWEAVRLHSRLAPYGSIALSETDRIPKELNDVDWQLIIADEAHRMKDPTSKQTRAVWAVANNTPLRWALTGTPVTNTPETLYPILHFLNPTEWPSKTRFISRYCNSAPARWGPGLDIFGLNEETKEEFFEIVDPRFRRMPKEVVLPDLPPIQRVRRYVDMSDEQARGYRTMANNMVAVDENGELIIAVNPVSKLTRLIQYSSACLEMRDDGTAKLVDPSCKLEQLMADLPDYLEAEESVVVFAVSRQLVEMAERRLQEKKIQYSVIKGGQSEEVRQREIERFQNKTVPVILVVIAAGGVGITLTAARIAIFLQRSYSNVDMKQAEARVHRIGSEHHESVIIVDYIANRTIENWQLNALEGKAAQLEDIVRDREAIEKLLRGEDED